MTPCRALAVATLLAIVAAAGPVAAQTPPARPTAAAAAAEPAPGVRRDEGSAPNIYRIVATSAGVLAGAWAMSLVIDGWVVDTFMSSGGLTAAEAFEVVQDMDSQSGFEAAAILLSGLVGGLAADRLYTKGAELAPPFLEKVDATFGPSLSAAGTALSNTAGWVQNRVGEANDWVQARWRELGDRWQLLLDPVPTVPVPGGRPGPVPEGRPGPVPEGRPAPAAPRHPA